MISIPMISRMLQIRLNIKKNFNFKINKIPAWCAGVLQTLRKHVREVVTAVLYTYELFPFISSYK